MKINEQPLIELCLTAREENPQQMASGLNCSQHLNGQWCNGAVFNYDESFFNLKMKQLIKH
jgi:hypothetical protein